MSNGNEFPGKPSFTALGALSGKITEGLSKIMTKEQVTFWNKNENQDLLMKKVCEIFSLADTYTAEREAWQVFYKDHFGWDIDFSRVLIPMKPGDGWRLLLIAKGMTMNKAFARCKALFKTWQYLDDLDKAIPTNARTASDNYAVWVRDGIEPDQEHLGKSTFKVDPEMKIGITILERIILEIKHFSETGKHLDIKGVTFCSGSHNSGGGVPYAFWHDGEFRVRWCRLDYSFSDGGVLSAVAI
jgi:hypothetical protein